MNCESQREDLSGRDVPRAVHIGLLLALAAVVYANTLRNSFTYDDFLYILNNPAVTSPSLKGFFVPTQASNLFRPVTFGSFALNWAIGFIEPISYHLINLLLHVAVTLLLYLVLSELLGKIPRAGTIAFAATLLFAVHPIHTEAVASIVGRSELLAAGFVLAAWLLHLRDKQIPALICFALALLSKESAIAFLPLTVAGDYARGERKPVQRYGWIAGISTLYIVGLWTVQGGRFGGVKVSPLDNPLVSLPAGWRILNAVHVAWKYVGLQVYPGTLSNDYSYNAIPLFREWRHALPWALPAIAVLALWIWAVQARRTGWIVAGAIYFAGFLATANILIPTGTIMGERLVYLPSAGFCLLIALVWIRVESHRPVLGWIVLAILLGALGTRTVMRNRDWKSNFTLYSAGVRAVPESARAHFNIGGQYMDAGQLEAAWTEFQMALRIYPDYPDALEYSGIILARRGEDREALERLQRAFLLTRTESTLRGERAVNLAALLMKLREADEAMKLLDEAIEVSPGNARAWSNRAAIHYWRGEMESARADAEAALRMDPANPQAQSLLQALTAGQEGSTVPVQ